MGDFVIYRDKKLPVESFQKFQEIRQSNLFSDVTLKVCNVLFPVHRIVLAATIPFFHAMFTSNMAESRQNEITIKGIVPKTMDSLLEFVYTGSIRITTSNACRLLSGSSYFQLFNVRDACCGFLEKKLEPANILGIRALASTLSCSSLEKAANHFIDENFVQIAHSEEYLSLDVSVVEDLISREKLHEYASAEQVYNAVMNWVKNDEGKRRKMLSKLLSKTKMHLMSPEFLVAHVGKEPLICTSLECRKLLEEAKDFLLLNDRLSIQTKIWAQDDEREYIYALIHTDKTGELVKYDHKSDSWIKEVSVCTNSNYFGPAITVLQNKLYFIGDSSNPTVNVFDLKTKIWSTAAPMKHTSRSGCAAVLQNIMYVCGGWNSDEVLLNVVQCYDPETNKWKGINPMKECRFAPCAVTLYDFLYVLGGKNRRRRSVALASVEIYDPQTMKWSLSTPMLTKRSHFGASVLNGKIYACGGHNGRKVSKTAEEYNPITRQWKFIQPMNTARRDFGLVSAWGRIYAIGGVNESGHLNTVEVYNPEEDKWSFVAPIMKIEGRVNTAAFHSHIV